MAEPAQRVAVEPTVEDRADKQQVENEGEPKRKPSGRTFEPNAFVTRQEAHTHTNDRSRDERLADREPVDRNGHERHGRERREQCMPGEEQHGYPRRHRDGHESRGRPHR